MKKLALAQELKEMLIQDVESLLEDPKMERKR